MFSFSCNIKLNTRLIVGIFICTFGCVCIWTFKDPAYWPVLAGGIATMVGGKIGNIDISSSHGGGGRDKCDKH